MSDDKSKTGQGTGDGTGPATDPAKSGTEGTTAMPFTELMGHIDSRIESIVHKVVGGKSSNSDGTDPGGTSETPESVAQQVRNEIAKLNGEEAAKQKDANRDVTIQQLQEQVTKLSEAAPTQTVSKLTQLMWGGRKK